MIGRNTITFWILHSFVGRALARHGLRRNRLKASGRTQYTMCFARLTAFPQ
jgi:hypothetical protein